MQHRQPLKGSCASIALPSTTKFAEVSSNLAEKLARQIQWMQKRGITIRLSEAERPSVEDKEPLPGTVIFFADSA